MSLLDLIPWGGAIGKALDVVKALLGWGQREEQKKDDFAIAENANLQAIAKEAVSDAEINEKNATLTHDQLVERLRQSQRSGQ